VSPTAVALGYLAPSIGLFGSVPQVMRARRTRSVEGLSWTSQVIGLVTGVLWGVYGITSADTAQILNNTMGLSLALMLAWVASTVREDVRIVPAALVVAGSAVAAVAVAVCVSPFAVAMVGTLVGSVRLIPQVRVALSGASLWGLHPWSVLLAVVSPLAWFAYGLAVSDVAVLISSGISTVMNSIICAYRLPARRTMMSLAGGRLGPRVAVVSSPLSARFPPSTELAVPSRGSTTSSRTASTSSGRPPGWLSRSTPRCSPTRVPSRATSSRRTT
jgi:uncharacterized protein with PQ loop repeat